MRELQLMLYAAREAVGQKQIAVAAATGISSRTIWRVEQNVGTTRFETLAKLRAYYGVQGASVVETPRQGAGWELVFDQKLAPASDAASGIFLVPPPPLLRAARAILGLTQIQLGEKSGVAHTTVRRLEQSVSDVEPETAYKLVLAFSELGIEFARPERGIGWRVHLRKTAL